MKEAIASIGNTGTFLFTIFCASRPRRDFLSDLIGQLYSVVVRSLPIIAVGGAFVGMVMTLQGYRTLSTYGATNSVGTLLGLSLYRELGPVLTALLFIGRAGSSMSAELGLMKATDQIAALSLMAIDPVAKTVVPRFWAAIIGMPLLCGFFCSFAIVAGYLEAVYVLGLDPGYFWSALKTSVDFMDDFVVAFIKCAVFGLIGALMATYTGFNAEPTIEGTSIATTRAVVNGSLLVLVFNFILSATLFK
ncbi:MAG: ABC transporter permease [Gammaproteobacteria bacterium HGW-Gammaproteobacteria-4]|nr:MAG: ABC transporter permease [Gammaproteobacteria bacterium HGW-Gammaproteobacteria-4]